MKIAMLIDNFRVVLTCEMNPKKFALPLQVSFSIV